MAITPLNSFADVQDFLDQILSDNNESAALSFAPHKVFWRNLTYDQFVNGNVPGVTDPATNLPMPVLVSGNSANSNLIMALQGIGAAFGAGQCDRADGPPFFTADQIA